MNKYVCPVCGFVYEEALGMPTNGIAPRTLWQDVPEEWACPVCAAPKNDFKKQQPRQTPRPSSARAEESHDLRPLTPGELSAVCSNLSKGCEKQNLLRESALFLQLADYYKSKVEPEQNPAPEQLLQELDQDLSQNYPSLEKAGEDAADRGALRCFTWGNKVARIVRAVLGRYQKEGAGFLENSRVFVCDICGFIYIGAEKPEICPVCKVPDLKIVEIERGA